MIKRGAKLLGLGVAVVGVLGIIGSATPDKSPVVDTAKLTSNSSTAANKAQITAKPTPKPIIETKSVVEMSYIPFSKTTAETSSLPKGTTKITTSGVVGTKASTYNVTSSNGAVTSKVLVKEEVTAQPVNEVTSTGTYVAPAVVTPTYVAPTPQVSCSNGSYISASGARVCSPSSNPSGASAQCGDGTYSYSVSRSGTCSHHGGVSAWY